MVNIDVNEDPLALGDLLPRDVSAGKGVDFEVNPTRHFITMHFFCFDHPYFTLGGYYAAQWCTKCVGALMMCDDRVGLDVCNWFGSTFFFLL